MCDISPWLSSFFFAPIGLTGSYLGLILAHTALATTAAVAAPQRALTTISAT